MKYLAAVSIIPLTACVPAGEPIISDFNGDSVKLVQNNYFGEGVRGPQTDAEAARICGKSGKTAEYASIRQVADYQVEHLYLCL